MATYVNDLRLTELATGEGSGTWGTTTNVNLELIGEALGYGTQDCFASDADSTTTVADGASDPARAMYFKVTSSATLTATRTLTIAPNTVSRVMLIENATTGSQSIAISQGSGGNVTIASGQTKMVYLDGAGSGGAVVDALADLELETITVADLTATTADINGGTIDGVNIGGSSAGAITGTTGQFNTSLNVDGTVTADGLRVDGDAALGLTAPTISEGFQLHVDAAGNGVWGGFGNSYLTANYKFNASNKFAGTGFAQLLEMVPSTGAFTVKASSASGTADATATMQNKMLVAANGDISFYDSAGSSQSFFWDASAEALGIGTSSPAYEIELAKGNAGGVGPTLYLHNTVDSVSVGHAADIRFNLRNDEATSRNAIIRAEASVGYGTDPNLIFLTSSGSTGTPEERMRITSAGNVGIGTTSFSEKLSVVSSSLTNATLSVDSSGGSNFQRCIVTEMSGRSPNDANSYFLEGSDTTTTRFVMYSNGGLANYQANNVNLSDERVKTDIAPLGSMWDKFKALEIVTFKYKDQTHDDDNIGVIAQQVEAVAPEFVNNDGFGETPEGEDPLKTIYTSDLYHATIKALQEAMARIETLEAEVAALKGA